MNALIDTGALHGDYISNKIRKQYNIPITPPKNVIPNAA